MKVKCVWCKKKELFMLFENPNLCSSKCTLKWTKKYEPDNYKRWGFGC